MASYQLTEDAEADVDGIYEYSILHFGLQQARDYVNSLHGCFGNLADNPRLGRDYSHVKANARRFEYQSHSVSQVFCLYISIGYNIILSTTIVNLKRSII